MAIKLKLLTKVFSIGLDELVDFLNTKGYYPSRNLQAQVPPEVVSLLHEKYGSGGGEGEEKKESKGFMYVNPSKTVGYTRFEIPNTKVGNGQKQEQKANKSSLRKRKQNCEKPIEPKKNDTIDLRIKAINRPNRIITEPFGTYEYGVLFPKDILFHGEAISISLSEKFISQKLKVGYRINCKVAGSSPDRKIAFLTYELTDSAFKGLDVFETLTPGRRYSINLVDTLPDHFLVAIADTDLHGVILKNQIDESIQLDKHGSLRVQLVEKPDNPLQLLRFVKPIAAKKHVVVENLDEIVNNFLTKPEMDAITPDGLEVVKSILSKFPELKRKEADQITGFDLYCRVDERSPMNYFIKQKPDYFLKHSFWVSVNLDNEEPSIALFKESPSIVIELKAFNDDVFTVTQFDSRKSKLTQIILQKYNKYSRLKVAGSRLHFISRYEPVPLDYNTEDVIDYLGKLYEFNSSILPSIDEAIREKTLLSAKDYYVLSSFLKYQCNKEYEKESERVFVAPNRVSTASVQRIGDYPALKLKLDPDEIKTLIGSSEEDNSAMHVSVVDSNGNELLTGVLDTDGDSFVLRSDHGHVSLTDFLNEGIRLQRRANIKHIKIQMNAIDDFVLFNTLRGHQRNALKVQKFYQDLINNRLETPDLSKVGEIEFKNPLFNTAAGDNTQTDAVKKALGNKNVLLIQGPPGTGKTTIIVEIIEQLVARGKKVLVCSQAHAAVKNIYDRLEVRCPGMKVLALDDKDEVTAAAKNFDEEAYTRFLSNNLDIIGCYRRGMGNDEIEKKIKTFTYNSAERTKDYREKHYHVIDFHDAISNIPPQKITFLLDRLKRETLNLNSDLLKAQVYREKDVILGTCIGIGMDPVMRNKDAVHFDTVIVDEAGKANLAETIVPLQLGDRFILVGDHRQLPPYYDRQEIADYMETAGENVRSESYSQQEVEKAMNKSLFSDFFDHQYFPVENKVTLNYQFRMNPQIGQYISDLFYGGQLISGEGTEKQTVSVEGFPDPVTFVDTYANSNNEDNDPRETKSPDGSVFNRREVKDICEEILPRVSVALDSNPELTVGIITPYKAQYRKLKEALKDTRFKDSIYTIDSIQGSEFDIVVFSFVRAFCKKVGFLDDLRRLNVSLSRAKKKLILVGHLPTLRNPYTHIETQIEEMVSPVEVFSSIANRIKRYGELSPIERFANLNFEVGHLFNDCEFHDDGDCFIVIHLEEFDFISKVPRKGYSKYNDGDALEVVLSGFDAAGRPQFDTADLYKFLQTHSETESYEGVITNIYDKLDGGKSVYITVDGYEDRLDIAPFLKDKHPEYYVKGIVISVVIDRYKNEPERIYFRPQISEAEQLESDNRACVLFTAAVKEMKECPMVVFRFKDNSEITLPCRILWHMAVKDEYYDLVKFSNGECKLNKHYLDDYIESHPIEGRYEGLIVSKDNNYCYVDVDGYYGVIPRSMADKKGLKVDDECHVSFYKFNKFNVFIQFSIV